MVGNPVVILTRWESREWFWHGGKASINFGTAGNNERDYFWAHIKADGSSPVFVV
jgi:heme-degrading monooxygenase HmoA